MRIIVLNQYLGSKICSIYRRKEFCGKLAITANFTSKRITIVDEISGVAFVYKQDFFNTLYEEFGIALENIVYYKVICYIKLTLSISNTSFRMTPTTLS